MRDRVARFHADGTVFSFHQRLICSVAALTALTMPTRTMAAELDGELPLFWNSARVTAHVRSLKSRTVGLVDPEPSGMSPDSACAIFEEMAGDSTISMV